MQKQTYQYVILNQKTGDVLKTVDSPSKAVETAFELSCVEAALIHSNAPDNGMVMALKIKDQKPVAVACSWLSNVDNATEQMTADAITYINHSGLIEPLLIECAVTITDVAKSDETGHSYAWFSKGDADYAATIYPRDKRISITWSADLDNSDNEWLSTSPSINRWVIEKVLIRVGIREEIKNLERDPLHYSWTWSDS